MNGQVVSQGVLVVKGVRDDGLRELLAVEVADTESEVTYQRSAEAKPYEDLFRRLKDRGLHGVRLVTSDDHRGLVKATQKHFQGATWQRCQVHVARNALGKVGGKHQRAISAEVPVCVRAGTHADRHAVFNVPALDWARELKGEVVSWARSQPKVAEWLETALEDGLACFALGSAPAPDSQHQRPRALQPGAQTGSTRRTASPRRYADADTPNRDAYLRLVTALCTLSEEWLAGRVYLDMGRLDASDADRAPQAAQEREEVKSMAAKRSLACRGTKVHKAQDLTLRP